MRIYPETTNPISVSKPIGEWPAHGTPVEIIPVDTINDRFSVKKVYIHNVTSLGYYELKLYKGLSGQETCITTLSFVVNNPVIDNIILENGDLILSEGERISATLSGDNTASATVEFKIGYVPSVEC